MKHSELHAPDILLWLLPLTLIVPNVALDITEQWPAAAKCTNLLLPLGIYMAFCGLSRKAGRTALLFLPVTFFAAFQLVLTFLYGESIIAVDMFINVATTSVSEATELLGNLGLAIATVTVLYVLPLGWGIWSAARGEKAGAATVRRMRRSGCAVAAAGIIALAVSYITLPGYSVLRQLFPVNVASNLVTAIVRTARTARYADTSKNFSYHAASERPDSIPEIYILVVGETSRADNWHLLGYDRPTTPMLEKRPGLIHFPRAISESNTTHKSVPLALSCVSADNFGDSIYNVRSIVTTFNEAGFSTAWLSNQSRNRSFIDFFSDEADTTIYTGEDGKHHYDHELIPLLRRTLDAARGRKTFVVLHTYGSHFSYNERYPAAAAHFLPDNHTQANAENRSQLINAYDNTILYTDALLDSIIATADSYGCPAALMYFSDHGEDIFDDSRYRFLHASPVPTFRQLHVPVLLWMSESHRALFPQLYANAAALSGESISSSRCVFDTMLSLAGITTPYADCSKALTADRYRPAPRVYLNDYNEAVPLISAGLREPDFREFDTKNISYR